MKATPGQAFEREMGLVCDAYRAQGRANIRKVDPPSRSFTKGGKTFTTLLANPFLDFVGTWTELGGKAIMVEVKSTAEPRLAVLAAGQKGSGISHDQLVNALEWEHAGAAVAFLWQHDRAVRLLTPTMVRAATTERRSVPWTTGHLVPAGMGFCFHDFLTLLHPIHKTP